MTVELVEPQRLQLIPPANHAQHEFCFYLHDVMVDLLREAEAHQITTVTVPLRDNEEAQAFEKRNDPIAFLLETDRRDLAKRVTLNQVSLALYADMLHFLYEALRALEKRKFTVAFTLLRKPLKQNMLFAAWMCADEDDFFDQLERSPADYMEETDLPAARRLDLIKTSISRLACPSAFDEQRIYDIVFDKNLETGLAALFDKATHLVTSRGKLMRTEELNLNFIFKDPTENDIHESIYPDLAYILFYILLLQIDLYSRMKLVEKGFVDWVVLTSLGAYQALFVKGPSGVVKYLNKSFATFLRCPYCRTPNKIRKSAAARFFLTQRLTCGQCKLEHQFPLFWLLSHVEWSIKKDQSS